MPNSENVMLTSLQKQCVHPGATQWTPQTFCYRAPWHY